MLVENPMLLYQEPPDPVSLGKCENCPEEIIPGYEAYVWEDLYFCGINCFCQYMGLKEVNWD